MAAIIDKARDPQANADADGAATRHARPPASSDPDKGNGSWPASQWHFLVEQAKNMPPWVRVLTYLVILTLYAYNSLLPTALSGSMMQRDSQGHEFDNHTVAYAKLWFEGSTLTVKIDGASWRTPVINRGPWKTQHVRFYDAHDNPVGDLEPYVLSLLFASSDIALVFDEKTNQVQPYKRAGAVTGLLDLIPSASAAPLDKQANAASTDCDEGCRRIARLADVAPANLRGDAPLASLAPPEDQAGLRRTLARHIAIDPGEIDWAKIHTIDDFQRLQATYSAEGNITADVKSILARTPPTLDLRLLNGAETPQFRTARNSMKVPTDETVIGFLNATFTGDGVEGMLFGTRGIYYRTNFLRRDGPDVAFISYDDLAGRSVEDKGSSQVSLDQGQYFVTAKSSISSRQLVDVLTRIKQAAQTHRTAAAAVWR